MLAQSRSKLPAASTPAYKILTALRTRPASFWLACERAGLDYEADEDEAVLRRVFGTMIGRGQITTDGYRYAISDSAKLAFDRTDAAIYQGEVVRAPYRPAMYMPVTIIKQSGARCAA